ncbi:MAG: hypothetical protein M5R36_05655 [Deltaproteobacteria bacterium]|nr:hypothetical protein [Deltaproteobacteria bacterium]
MFFFSLLIALAAAVSCVDDAGDIEDEPVSSPARGNWTAETRDRINAEQYRLKPEGEAFTGANPAQRFSVELDAAGAAVSIRKHDTVFDWVWTTVGIGRDDFFIDAARTSPAAGDCDLPPPFTVLTMPVSP